MYNREPSLGDFISGIFWFILCLLSIGGVPLFKVLWCRAVAVSLFFVCLLEGTAFMLLNSAWRIRCFWLDDPSLEIAGRRLVAPEELHRLLASPERPPQKLSPSAACSSVAPETGELSVESAVEALLAELDQKDRELTSLQRDCETLTKVLETKEAGTARIQREMFDLKCRLERFSASEDVLAGAMHLVGRLFRPEQGGLAVVIDGKPVRLATATGWTFPGENGSAVSVQAIFKGGRWFVWKVRELLGDAATDLPLFDEAEIRKKIGTTKPRLEELPSFEEKAVPKENVRRDNHNASAIQLHVVLVRKNRGNWPLTSEMADAWKRHVADVIAENGFGELLAIETGSEPNPYDHLHFAVTKVPPSAAISHELGRIKATSSRRFAKQFPEVPQPFYSSGLFVASAGGANLEAVRRYIVTQNEV